MCVWLYIFFAQHAKQISQKRVVGCRCKRLQSPPKKLLANQKKKKKRKTATDWKGSSYSDVIYLSFFMLETGKIVEWLFCFDGWWPWLIIISPIWICPTSNVWLGLEKYDYLKNLWFLIYMRFALWPRNSSFFFSIFFFCVCGDEKCVAINVSNGRSFIWFMMVELVYVTIYR